MARERQRPPSPMQPEQRVDQEHQRTAYMREQSRGALARAAAEMRALAVAVNHPDNTTPDFDFQKGMEHTAMLQGLRVGTRHLLRDRASIASAAVRRPDPPRAVLKACSETNRNVARQGERVRAVATIKVMPGPLHRGKDDDPVRNSSTARAHCRPSRMAQTTSD